MIKVSDIGIFKFEINWDSGFLDLDFLVLCTRLVADG